MKKFSWKKILACATTFTLCASMFLGITADASSINGKGDINGDGTVNVFDLMEVSKYVINVTDTINAEQADVNSDGAINILDVMLIATFIVNPETPDTDTTNITLADTGITVDGKGAEINGSTVTITSAGNYTITGTLSDGQICVDTADTESVNITLNDVTVTNTTTSPFYVKSATGGTIITLADGTTNTLTDPTTYVYADETTTEPDATLFCENNLTIKGTGSLVVNANYGDGICSKDGLTIENGTLDITSLDDAIRGKDYVEIKGGSVKTNAEGDGIKSTAGYVNISGGTHKIESSADGLQAELESTISGGTTQIYSAKGISVTAGYNVTGGTLIATAHKNEVATPANSTANVITMNFAEQQVKKTTVTIGEFSFKPSKKYQYTMVCSSDLSDGTYKADLDGVTLKHDGSETGEFTIAGNTVFTGIQAINSSQQPTTTTENVITLNGSSMIFEGTGATVDGNTVTITEPGDYTVNGESTDGKIIVNVDKTTYVDGKVKLLLNGVTMTNSSDSPIYVESIDDKVIIETASGTINTISDGTDYTNADEDAGAIYSKDDLNFKGDGTLVVNGNKLDAIVSKNDIKFKSGTYQITSADDGIRGKDSVTVEAGNFTIKAGGDGIKSTDTNYSTGTDTSKFTGYVTILDGTFDIDATYDGIQAETNLTVNGGTFDIYTSTGAGTASSGGNQGGGGFPGGGGWNQGGNWGQDTDTTTDSAKALKAGSQINITDGNFTIDSTDDAVHSNDTVIIDGGTFDIKTGDDGIHADKNTTVNNGNIKIQQCYEGLEGLAVNITGGNISIVSSDDAINAAGGTDSSGNNNNFGGGWNQGGMSSSGGELNISGGYIWFNAGGDGLDSNGSITLSGGTVVDNGPTSDGDSPIDADGTVTYSGTRIMALGSTGMMSEGYGSSGTYVASTGLNASQGTLVVVTDSDNNVLGAYTTTQQSAGIIFSSPEIVNGATAKIYTGGTLTGATAIGEDGFYTGGTYSGGTEVSSSSSGGNGGGGHGGWGGF